MFEIRYDRDTNILHYAMSGFWTQETLAAFAVAMMAQAKDIQKTRANFDALCDSINFPVQTTEISEALGRIREVATTMTNGRIAIVVGSVLNKFQAERTLAHEQLCVFLSMDEAQDWLKAGADAR